MLLPGEDSAFHSLHIWRQVLEQMGPLASDNSLAHFKLPPETIFVRN
ncbi:unnamed protein product [Spirodela intermedia]|uniref:Uncharacterized protein n=2 Tax=Spirodela intermedia TaxID=51605 RepID=A0A7I8JCC3_SPIIN|nr:unnamed protein product [Spirodela intermedia]CAA6667631.1 unnamed protein product [Spirodela intermedia]CAA7404448.1 unnamed protein product [Spirodela intermedia]